MFPGKTGSIIPPTSPGSFASNHKRHKESLSCPLSDSLYIISAFLWKLFFFTSQQHQIYYTVKVCRENVISVSSCNLDNVVIRDLWVPKHLLPPWFFLSLLITFLMLSLNNKKLSIWIAATFMSWQILFVCFDCNQSEPFMCHHSSSPRSSFYPQCYTFSPFPLLQASSLLTSFPLISIQIYHLHPFCLHLPRCRPPPHTAISHFVSREIKASRHGVFNPSQVLLISTF